MAFLQIVGIQKCFGGFVAVENLKLDVEKGEFVALLGPSGCGKTTTLHMIAGFLEPSAGQILIEGHDLTRVPVNRRDIGIVFQNYALFPHMTVEKNVAFGLEMRRVPVSERRERVARALELVHLAPFAGRYPKELSGGQQQRVALARALVIEPKILLLDEPLSNLDAKLREDMQIELKMLQRKLGITTILVTHDQTEAMALSDRIAVMNCGRIVQCARPWESYERPATAFVANFLGKTNFLAAETERIGEDLIEVRVGDARFKVRAPGWVHQRGLLSVRPEKITFVDGKGFAGGRITTRVLLGNTWLYQVQTEAFGTLLVCEQNNIETPRTEGAEVSLVWLPAHAHLLPETAA